MKYDRFRASQSSWLAIESLALGYIPQDNDENPAL